MEKQHDVFFGVPIFSQTISNVDDGIGSRRVVFYSIFSAKKSLAVSE